MRNAALLMGTLLLAACSIDHIVVAALDQAAGANTGGASGAGAGSSGLLASAAGEVTVGGSFPQGGTAPQGGAAPQGGTDRILLTSGGSNVDVRIGADAGATSETICSCSGQQTQLCGSDGITYTADCEEGSTCLAPTISCFHACPCLAEEPADTEVITWFPQACAPMAQCTEGFFCMTFTNVTRGEHLCTGSGN
jgi:hypothetical protein